MVYLYTGTPGSGKSLHMARDIVNFCDYGKEKYVIVNFPVRLDYIKHPERLLMVEQEDLTPQAIVRAAFQFWGGRTPQEGRIKVFIDEAQLIFNSREWNKEGRKDWITLFTQHRKLGMDIYLVAQFDEMIDKQIRSLVEYHVIHRKITNFGVIGAILKWFTDGLFIAVYKWYGIDEKTSQEYFLAMRKYTRIYDTLTLFSGALGCDLGDCWGDALQVDHGNCCNQIEDWERSGGCEALPEPPGSYT